MADAVGEVSMLLRELRLGRKDALHRLVTLVYDELGRVAGRCMCGERCGHTLQPTALVHEVFQRQVDQDHADWHNCVHFIAVAAQIMRRLLVDHARHRGAARCGVAVTFDDDLFERCAGSKRIEEVLAVDDILDRRHELDPRQARIAELRYFGGLSAEETAEAMDISVHTVKSDRAIAKAWLRVQLTSPEAS